MTQTFTCPSCGAPLDYDGSGRSTIECPYCNSSVIVPQEMRGQRSERVSPEVTMSLQGQAANLRELSRLVKAGQKVQAYNLYQQVFKVNLTDAMRAVDQLSQGGAVVITSNVMTPSSSYGTPPAVSTNPVNYTAPPIITTSYTNVRPQRPVLVWVIFGFVAFTICMTVATTLIPFVLSILFAILSVIGTMFSQ